MMVRRDRKSSHSRVYIRQVGEGRGIRELELGLLIVKKKKKVVVRMSFGLSEVTIDRAVVSCIPSRANRL